MESHTTYDNRLYQINSYPNVIFISQNSITNVDKNLPRYDIESLCTNIGLYHRNYIVGSNYF